MRKIIIYLNLLIAVCLLHACIDDKGNYEYLDEESVMQIKIDGLCSDTSIVRGSALNLSPIVHNADDSSRYSYSWYIMDYQAAGSLPKQWDLSDEKDLNWTVSLDAARYRLNFRVYDNALDIFVRHEIIVTITATPMSTGWYILKDDNNETDIDYISLEGERYNDILSSYESKISGTAISMAYQSGRYYHNVTNEDGSVTTKSNLSVYHILTTEDIRTYDAKDFTLYKTYEDQFYAAPEVCRPQFVTFGSNSNTYLINDGKIHYIYGMTSNIGKYSAAFSGFYDLTDCFLPYNGSSNLIFDQQNRSFFIISSTGTNMTPLEEAANATDTLTMQNMDYDYVCSGSYSNNIGIVVMRNRTDGSHLLLQEVRVYDPSSYSNKTEWLGISPVPDESQLGNAQIIAQGSATSFFYFTVGDGVVYSYTNAQDASLEQRERKRLSFSGETITHMLYLHQLKTGENSTTEALAVLTTTNETWKLRVYALLGESTPELNNTPIMEYEGTGNGRYLLYRTS